MALSLWIIDVRNVITEVRLTLLSPSNDTLDNLYAGAVTDILRLASVEDVLYAYMVRIRWPHRSVHAPNHIFS